MSENWYEYYKDSGHPLPMIENIGQYQNPHIVADVVCGRSLTSSSSIDVFFGTLESGSGRLVCRIRRTPVPQSYIHS